MDNGVEPSLHSSAITAWDERWVRLSDANGCRSRPTERGTRLPELREELSVRQRQPYPPNQAYFTFSVPQKAGLGFRA